MHFTTLLLSLSGVSALAIPATPRSALRQSIGGRTTGTRQSAVASFFGYADDSTCDFMSGGTLYNVVASDLGRCADLSEPSVGVMTTMVEGGNGTQCAVRVFPEAGCAGEASTAYTNMCQSSSAMYASYRVTCPPETGIGG